LEEIERVRREIGLTDAEDRCEAIDDRRHKLDWRILKASAETYGDLAIKFKILAFFGEEFGADEIFADFKKLVKRPAPTEALPA
jgi:hypothetical protein